MNIFHVIPTIVAGKTLQEIALDAVVALKERKAFKQVDVAKHMNTAQAAVSETLAGKRRVTLRFLEAVSKATGVHPGELLMDPKRDEMKIVSGIEMQFLRYLRKWPLSTQMGLLTFLSFFADEDDADEGRRARQQLRDLPDGKKRTAYAYLTMLTEGFLPGEDLTPDIRKGLELPEINAPRSTHTATAKRRTPKAKT